MLDDSGLPGDFWVLAAQYSVYVRNRCPRASNPGGVSPFQAFTSEVPDVGSLRPFGCKAFMHLPPARRPSKLEPRAVEAIFVGVQTSSNTYKLWVPASWDNPGAAGRLYESRDVRFDPGWTLGGVPRVAVQSGGADCDGEVVIEPPAAPPVVPEAPVPAQEEQQPQVQEEIQPLAQEVRPRVRVEQPLVREGRVLDPPQVLRRSGRLGTGEEA